MMILKPRDGSRRINSVCERDLVQENEEGISTPNYRIQAHLLFFQICAIVNDYFLTPILPHFMIHVQTASEGTNQELALITAHDIRGKNYRLLLSVFCSSL